MFCQRSVLEPWPSHRRLCGIRFVVVAWLLTLANATRAQVPDESQLPTYSPPAVVPSEAQLPSDMPLEPSTKKPAPDESTLPGDLSNATEPAIENGVKESSLSPGSMRPWLRLRFDSHTGAIRSLALSGDGSILATAGEDKELHLWARPTRQESTRKWFHRRTVRWQVERSTRGRIYAVAVHGTLAAIAGDGAMGGLGEIWIVDVTTGNLVRTLVDTNRGHRQVIASLAWRPVPVKPTSSDANKDSPALMLASADVSGRVLLWSADAATGIWSPQTVTGSDQESYKPEVAAALEARRLFLPICFLGQDNLIVPQYAGPSAQQAGAANWQLRRYNLAIKAASLVRVDHVEMITAMCASDDGLRLATADALGRISQVRFDASAKALSAKVLEGPRRVAVSMDYRKDGDRLLLSTLAASTGQPDPTKKIESPTARLQWLNTADPNAAPAVLSEIALPNHSWACTYDERTNEAIASTSNQLLVSSLNADRFTPSASQPLAPTVGPIRRVAFSNTKENYRILLESDLGVAEKDVKRHQFDLSAVKLEPEVIAEAPNAATPNAAAEGQGKRAEWIDSNAAQGIWSLRSEVTAEGMRSVLYEGEQKRAPLPLRGAAHGAPTSTAWFQLPANVELNQDAKLAAVVGTNGRNNIYVFECGSGNNAKLLRQFRGHGGQVLSLSVSPDQRYLVSGSDDSTVCVWKLEDLFTAEPIVNRWGATFEQRGERLFVASVRRDGPLYFRGVREGDQLVSVRWVAEDPKGTNETSAAADAKAILAALNDTSFDTLLEFQVSRRGIPREGFQSFPAWQPVATLFVDRTRQWAFWTPAGFYDSSFGGNELFGWQINRGLNNPPDFFRANQFRERLENPAAMRKLLAAGDLTTAMEQSVAGIAPPPGEAAIVNQILSKPTIRWIEPSNATIATQSEVNVKAEITVPIGSALEPPKVFAGGVPAVDRKLISHRRENNVERYLYSWTARLPQDARVPMEIVAASDSGAVDRAMIELENQSPPSGLMPRMYFLGIGISDYADPEIQPLDFASRGAGVMAQLFRDRTRGLYRTKTSELLDRDAIRPLWRDYAAEAARELASDVRPDDVVVMYMCGHGYRDRRTNQWYFVTADARYHDLMSDRYDDLLSFDDLAMLGSLPCRKLAIIDSCHSGAVQPAMRNDDLKAAMRMLHGDVVLTITASEGEEEAAEQKERQLGRFTSHLVDALTGKGDLNKDGIVTLDETIQHAIVAAEDDAKATGFVQHPTAGPIDLLPTTHLPLTRIR